MTVSIIAAVARNFAIGKNNDLIWKLPDDMRFFSRKTTGHHVIMGRRNWVSIPFKYRPLPNRVNIVVSGNPDFSDKGCIVVGSIEEGLTIAERSGDDEVFIIGGGQIYRLALEKELAQRMYITWVHETFDADTFFPEFDAGKWKITAEEFHQADERNPYDFTITVYEKKPAGVA